jgi:hypothetical protein
MEEEQTKRENWVEEYNQMDELARKARMEKHVDEYLVFGGVCQDNHAIDDDEFQLLWTTWCIRRGIK